MASRRRLASLAREVGSVEGDLEFVRAMLAAGAAQLESAKADEAPAIMNAMTRLLQASKDLGAGEQLEDTKDLIAGLRVV